MDAVFNQVHMLQFYRSDGGVSCSGQALNDGKRTQAPFLWGMFGGIFTQLKAYVIEIAVFIIALGADTPVGAVTANGNISS